MTTANCVGAPPGRGPHCPPLVRGQVIRGRSARDQGWPWPAPDPGLRTRGARKRRILPPVRVRQSGRADETRRDHCAPSTTATSDRRCARQVRRSPREGLPSIPSIVASGPLAAPTSHTSAVVRCTPAVANTCGGIRCKGSGRSARVERGVLPSPVGLPVVVPVPPEDLEAAVRAAPRSIAFRAGADRLDMLLKTGDADYNSSHGLGSFLSGWRR
jgi:hypothetical protein